MTLLKPLPRSWSAAKAFRRTVILSFSHTKMKDYGITDTATRTAMSLS